MKAMTEKRGHEYIDGVRTALIHWLLPIMRKVYSDTLVLMTLTVDYKGDKTNFVSPALSRKDGDHISTAAVKKRVNIWLERVLFVLFCFILFCFCLCFWFGQLWLQLNIYIQWSASVAYTIEVSSHALMDSEIPKHGNLEPSFVEVEGHWD